MIYTEMSKPPAHTLSVKNGKRTGRSPSGPGLFLALNFAKELITVLVLIQPLYLFRISLLLILLWVCFIEGGTTADGK